MIQGKGMGREARGMGDNVNAGKKFNIALLNMQGGRSERKSVELYSHMREERIAFFAVVETHLRVTEGDFVWEGCNRTGQNKRGGGIGCVWVKSQQWTRCKPMCKEQKWIRGRLLVRQ